MFLSKIKNNKIINYLLSRYLVYFLQFVVSMVVAVKLGPYYLGIWGFFTLLLNYFSLVNFGIGNSLNIFLVQNKNNAEKSNNYVVNATFIIMIMAVAVVLIMLYHYFIGISAVGNKYDLGNFFYVLCLIAIIEYFNGIYMNVARVRNRINSIAIAQSTTIILKFILIFFFAKSALLQALIWASLAGSLISFFIYSRKAFTLENATISGNIMQEIFNKGLLLFIYNCSFYFILVSIRTIISYYYTVEEFGYFNFAFSLANTILLLQQAFSFIIYPKIIDKLNSKNVQEIKNTLNMIRENYISFSHLLIYVAIIFFPVFLLFFPTYANTGQSLNLIALSILLSTNSFGYTAYLNAQNKEKTSAKISLITLLSNIGIGLFLVNILQVSYQYIILATLIAYYAFALFSIYWGEKFLGTSSFFQALKISFPLKLLIPYLTALGITIINNVYLFWIPLIIYILLNMSSIKEMTNKIKVLINNPNAINL